MSSRWDSGKRYGTVFFEKFREWYWRNTYFIYKVGKRFYRFNLIKEV